MDNNNEKTLEELQRQSGIMKKKLTVILISVLGAVALILGTASVQMSPHRSVSVSLPYRTYKKP